jgi:hypothetical protein
MLECAQWQAKVQLNTNLYGSFMILSLCERLETTSRSRPYLLLIDCFFVSTDLTQCWSRLRNNLWEWPSTSMLNGVFHQMPIPMDREYRNEQIGITAGLSLQRKDDDVTFTEMTHRKTDPRRGWRYVDEPWNTCLSRANFCVGIGILSQIQVSGFRPGRDWSTRLVRKHRGMRENCDERDLITQKSGTEDLDSFQNNSPYVIQNCWSRESRHR